MKVIVSNTKSVCLDIPPEVALSIYRELLVDTSGLVRYVAFNEEGNPENKFKWVASEWSAYDQDSCSFPSGLFWRVVKYFPASTEVVDARTNKVEPIRTPQEVFSMLELEPRDYQIGAIESLIKNSRGVFNIATNGGKTEILALMLMCYPTVCTIIVTAELTGLYEITERLDKHGVEYTKIDSTNKVADYSGINVCSLDTVRRLEDILGLLQKAQILIWDECDDSSTAVSGSVLGENCNAYIRVYLSGTPFTDNPVHNMKLVGVSGEEIVNIGNAYLIAKGYSANPIIGFHSSLAYAKKDEKMSYPEARSKFINKNEEFASRVGDLVEEVKADGVVVLYEHKSHGTLLKRILTKRGLRCMYIDGHSSPDQRNEAKKRLVSGNVDVILASSIWNRALDFGFPQHWIYVGGMKATNRIKQRYGRALRKKANTDNSVWIHEFYVWGHKALREHSFRRYQICLEEGFPVVLMNVCLEKVLNDDPESHKEFNYHRQTTMQQLLEKKE